jgi:hypothetical protein
MQLKTLSALVGAVVCFSSDCTSVKDSSDYSASSNEVYSTRSWNPLYRIGDPAYWLLGEVKDKR